jgi:hypothetical protein
LRRSRNNQQYGALRLWPSGSDLVVLRTKAAIDEAGSSVNKKSMVSLPRWPVTPVTKIIIRLRYCLHFIVTTNVSELYYTFYITIPEYTVLLISLTQPYQKWKMPR